jgi:high-affinity Fe2+/Pb2+ permease
MGAGAGRLTLASRWIATCIVLQALAYMLFAYNMWMHLRCQVDESSKLHVTPKILWKAIFHSRH